MLFKKKKDKSSCFDLFEKNEDELTEDEKLEKEIEEFDLMDDD